MHILLPPSEGKQSPEVGNPINLEALSFASQLTTARKSALKNHPQLKKAPSTPAHDIYSGVLYAALGWDTLNASARRRAQQSIIIISAAFGAVRLTDSIPFYKAKIDNRLWREPIAAALAALPESMFVDCRSSTYQQVFTPPRQSTVVVRVFKQVDTQRTVITHMSKHYRGLLARLLVSHTRTPKTPADVYAVAATTFACELTPPSDAHPWFLDILIHA